MTNPPRATYRLQLDSGLDLFEAAGLVGYLAELGVSHVYTSPFLQSAPEAGHGYAVVDHGRVDDRLGGEEGRRALVERAAAAGLGLVLDVVPNHMAVSLPSNRWFWDVLEHGPSSIYAGHFDVDWDPPDAPVRNKVLLPILADHYGRELEAGSLRISQERGVFRLNYHDHLLPLSPRSVALLVAEAGALVGSDELTYVARALGSLPPAASTDEEARRRRHSDASVLAGRLQELLTRPELVEATAGIIDEVNRDPDRLDLVLEEQNYRLARWRVAGQELGYRRFFDIDTLIGLRVEDPQVFADTHSLTLAWVAAGEADGLRIDHPDGLRRPGRYLRRLREAAGDAWIVVEKILEGDEELPDDWPVDGTTGYEFISDVTALFVDPAGEQGFTRLWAEMSGSGDDWEQVAETSKRDVLRQVLAGDLNRLTNLFMEVVQGRRRYRDFTRSELSEALTEALVAFDVYRTYVDEEGGATDRDLERIRSALAKADSASPELDGDLFDLLAAVLSGGLEGRAEADLRMRFQQLSGPVMAKGVEDTAFYRYLRLVALCDVGGDPGKFGLVRPAELHARFETVAERWPGRMVPLSTHDTKRSEDVRARLAVLSEIPQRWATTVEAWRGHNSRHRPRLLDGATEYLLYQTLVGAHPLGVDRLVAYLEKATKEAKLHTSWTDPSPDYDSAVEQFARRLAGDDWFQHDLDRFVASIAAAGQANSLAQKAIQLTAPGIPDLYQGAELWDWSLVDPDNRRPVDFELRRKLLRQVQEAGVAEIVARSEEGLSKLWLVHSLLQLRALRPDALGAGGEYLALTAVGEAADHVFSYLRGASVITVVPRLTLRLAERGGWRDTALDLPGGGWLDVFTGAEWEGRVPVGELLARFPVSVLEVR